MLPHSGKRRSVCARALTLIELVVVLLLLAAVAAIVVPNFASSQLQGQRNATAVTLQRVRDALVGGPDGPGYRNDVGGLSASEVATLSASGLAPLPSQLWALYGDPNNPGQPPPTVPQFDPNTGAGWRGPYLTDQGGRYTVDAGAGFAAVYGSTGDLTPLDAWGRAVVIQTADDDEIRLLSAGPNGRLETGTGDALAEADDLLLIVQEAP